MARLNDNIKRRDFDLMRGDGEMNSESLDISLSLREVSLCYRLLGIVKVVVMQSSRGSSMSPHRPSQRS